MSTLFQYIRLGLLFALLLTSTATVAPNMAHPVVETVFAQSDPVGQGLNKVSDKFQGQSEIAKSRTVGDLLISVINWLLAVTMVIAILFIIIGGFWYITSAGNEEQASKGRRTLTYAIIGLVLVVLSYTIVYAVTNSVLDSGQ